MIFRNYKIGAVKIDEVKIKLAQLFITTTTEFAFISAARVTLFFEITFLKKIGFLSPLISSELYEL